MKEIYPEYYPIFKCKAQHCKHSCCKGWEIDIDERTLSFYNSLGGELGEKLKKNIASKEREAHFLLEENERCPFLLESGLCEIISKLGETALCDICFDHPRFRNHFDTFSEIGLGMTCESAAELILNYKKPFRFSGNANKTDLTEKEKKFLKFRKRLFEISENPNLSFQEKKRAVLSISKIKYEEKSISELIDFYLTLERLDEKWTKLLDSKPKSFEEPPGQLLTYFLFRHLSEGIYDGRLRERIIFSLESTRLIGCLKSTDKGLTFEKTARLYSSEIEYSDENIEKLLDFFA